MAKRFEQTAGPTQRQQRVAELIRHALAEVLSLPDIMRFASAPAALKCTKFGGAAGAPTRAEVETFLSKNS